MINLKKYPNVASVYTVTDLRAKTTAIIAALEKGDVAIQRNNEIVAVLTAPSE